jgi:uncharacterized membrane protein YqgA involved in biofilm formation
VKKYSLIVVGVYSHAMYGTLVNVATVIIGSSVGLILRRGLPERIKRIIFQGIGLVTLFIGVQMALQTSNLVVLFFSILLGAIIGEAVDIQSRLETFGSFLKTKTKSKEERFTEGVLTAFLIFCVGSMTIVGAIQDGLNGDSSILIAKSILDGFVSVSLASVLGIGVMFSAVPLFVFQGAITVLAACSRAFFTEILISQLSAVGGILLLGLGINMLEIKEIKVSNLLPALLVVPIIAYLFP